MSVLLRTRHLEYVKIEHYAKNIIHRHTGEVELKIFLFSLIQLSATDKPFKDTAAIFMKKLVNSYPQEEQYTYYSVVLTSKVFIPIL